MSKSFDGAMVFTEVMFPDCDKSMLDRLQRAHEYDMEMADKSAYHRGFEDGQRSMDAEHRAVAMRLQGLPLNEGSHENLSAIAKAVMYCESYFGWTQDACKTLRDELIRLLGGIHDDPVSVVAIGDAYGDDCHRHDGEAWRVTYDEPKSCKCGETIKSGGECDGKMMESGENHQIESTITDELRECVRMADRQYDDTPWYEMGDDSEADHTICLVTEGELLRVADGIDEWFKRLCEQQEAVLQQTIDEMAEFREHDAEYASTERDMLQAKLIEHKALYRHYKDLYTQCVAERRELQERLDRSRAEYCETCEEAETTDVLRAKLDAVREALDGQR